MGKMAVKQVARSRSMLTPSSMIPPPVEPLRAIITFLGNGLIGQKILLVRTGESR